jgi:hypothetical protein
MIHVQPICFAFAFVNIFYLYFASISEFKLLIHQVLISSNFHATISFARNACRRIAKCMSRKEL